MIKLLLIEDDEACAYALQGGLELLDAYDIKSAENGREGLEVFNSFSPDVLVTDIEMPEMDGYELVKQIRKKDKSVIIIMESGKTMPKDVLKGYELGVDDYIKKPFVAEELHAHIQAIVKRSQQRSRNSVEDSLYLHIGNYKLDSKEDTLELQAQKQKLTKREAGILKLLYENKNTLVSRDKILNAFWKEEEANHFHSRSLDVFISKLRKYLSQDSNIKITSVKGEGIMLEVYSLV